MDISKVEAQSKKVVQPYAWGHAVWHVWGTDKAEPLVLLHGGSGSWTHWLRNVSHLSQKRAVWALDIPGFGESDLPDGASDADDLVPYVAEILQHTFKGNAVDVMGFSFGALTAGLVAAQHTTLIRQLMLVGAPGLGLFGRDLPMRGMLPDMDDAAEREVHTHNLRAMMFAHAETVTDEVVDLQQANVARDRLRRRRVARTDVLARAQTQWVCPVHGVWGELDALYTGKLQQVPHVLTRLNSFTVVPDAGHWVMFERPDAFHAALDPLLRSSNSA